MNLIYLETIDSTNNYVKENIETLNDTDVIYTFNQTAGRGRLNRVWENTGSDNLFITFCLKPFDTFDEKLQNFTQYLSVIAAKTIEEYGIKTEIKWPNDILINGKKVAGILAETSVCGNKFNGLALGIGLNINSDKEILNKIDKPATSLNIELNKKINKEEFLDHLTLNFYLLYNKFTNKGFSLIKEDYIKRATFLNKEIKLNILGTIHTGIAVNITDTGAIVLRENDINKTFHIGDIL